MQIDPQVLLVLLAIRAMGGKVPTNDQVFKALKNGLSQAKSDVLVQEVTVAIPSISKAGKPGQKKVKMFEVTPAGERLLEETSNPDAFAATMAGLQRSLESDRAALRQDILAAVAQSGKEKKKDPSKEIAALSEMISKIAKRLEALEQSLASTSGDDLMARVDQAFAGLSQKIAALRGGEARPSSATATHTPQATLAESLQQAYRKLCQFVEFEDGLVEIPRLYHETRKAVPSLSVAAFQQELQRLWSGKQLELKILNEERSASEPDKGILKDDGLYYYVMWSSK